jgi:PAS domain S-box-containing protein
MSTHWTVNRVVIYSHAVDAVTRQLTWVSENVKSLLGYEVDECQALDWWTDRLHPDDRAAILASLPTLWSDGRHACEYRFRAQSGGYRWLRDEVRLIRNRAGEPLSCIGSWSDLTERNQAADLLSEPETQIRNIGEAALQIVEITPGIGTSFKVYLPRDLEADVAHPAPQVPPALRSGSETVLLVEDDNQVRALARLVLGSHGYTVLEAHDGDEALRVCAQHAGTIDLLISDVIMPHLSGPQLAQRITSLRPTTRVLFLSGYADDAVVHHGVLDPGAAFLQKPFALEALARKVRETLDHDE